MTAADGWGFDETMLTRQVAEVFGVSPTTVQRWADTGRLVSMRTLGGHRRFSKRQVLHLVAHGFPPGDEDLVCAGPAVLTPADYALGYFVPVHCDGCGETRARISPAETDRLVVEGALPCLCGGKLTYVGPAGLAEAVTSC